MRHADTELFKDKIEVSLDGKQIFYLFFGGAVIASLVFVLGVMVGKRVEARAHVGAQPETSAARDPLAALDELSANAGGALAFPSVLAGDDGAALGPVDEALAANSERAPDADEPPAAAKPKPKPAPKAEAKPAPKAEAKPAAKAEPKAEDKPAAKAEPKAEDKPAAKAEPKAEDKPKADADKTPKFTLQLSSFQNRAEADAFFDTLKGAGFKPYIVEAQVPDKGTWYRVRLGRYESYQGAIDAKMDFEKQQNIIAYVTRLKTKP